MTQLADASRRDSIAAVASVAAAASAAQDAQAQTPSNPRFFNPTGMSKPTGYSQVVEINGPHRTIYLAGQTGIDANGPKAVSTTIRPPTDPYNAFSHRLLLAPAATLSART